MLLAALLFIGPAVVMMLGLAELYLHFGGDRRVQLVLLGVDAAVVGIVARAAVDLTVFAQRGATGLVIAAAAFTSGVLGVNPIVVLAGGGLIALIVLVARRGRQGDSPRFTTTFAWLAAVHAPAVTAGLLPLALTFLKIGAVAFGSGYVLLPFLHADFVGGSFHLTDRQVADAFAVSQVTPGPVFAVAAFLGVQISGIPGGVVAALAIFTPSLVFVPMVSTVLRLTEAHASLRAALDGVVMAAVGLIASACVVLARVAFLGPIEVLTAIAVFAMLWRWPRAQPAGAVFGLLAGLLVMSTGT
jgi:chromate transporter